MRPAEISNESIIEAGQALIEAGRNITGFALRQRIGGGNPSRLKQVWDEYASSQADVQVEPVAELPVEVAQVMEAETRALTERLARLAIEVNDKAVKAAERRVAEVVRAAGEQREQAERELADAAQAVDELEANLEEKTAAHDALEAKVADLNKRNQAQDVELAQLRERLAHADQAAKQVTQQAMQAAAAHAAEMAKIQKGAEQARAELALVRGELDKAHTELATVKAKASAADEAHQEQRKLAAAEAHRIAERMTKAEAARDAATKEARQAREEAARLRGQVEAMQAQAADLMRAIADRQSEAKPAKGR